MKLSTSRICLFCFCLYLLAVVTAEVCSQFSQEKFPDGRRTVNLGEMVEAMIGDDDEHDASVKARATDIDKSVAQKPQGSTELPASRKDGEEISDKANPGNIPEHTEVKVVKEKATSAASTRSDSEA